MKRLLVWINNKLHGNLDKVLHFLLSGLIAWFMGAAPTFFIGVGVEFGDYKNYGHATMKKGTAEQKSEYVKNTVLDLLFDVLGIAVFLTIKVIIQ